MIRIYLDVDGVINVIPSPTTLELWDSGQASVPFYSDQASAKSYHLRWRKKVVDKIVEWSAREDVELWWLTTWKHNGPEVLDMLWNINSAGFLHWDIHKNDFTQGFKMFALQEHQQLTPSPFIWADDIAVVNLEYQNPFERREDYLAIQPDTFTGLTDDSLKRIQKFVNTYTKEN